LKSQRLGTSTKKIEDSIMQQNFFCKAASISIFSLTLAFSALVSHARTVADDSGLASIAIGFKPVKSIPTIQKLELTAPMSYGALRILLNEADSLYRSERLSQAQETIIQLLELEPNFAPAWLRLGNIWQTQGNINWAIQAYQHAIEGVLHLGNTDETKLYNDAKVKALLNQSALHLNQARQAQLKIENLQIHSASFVQVRQDQEEQLAELEREQRRLSFRPAVTSDRPQMIVGKAR
jgi:tetratricopeptide (TPR) repeat protein